MIYDKESKSLAPFLFKEDECHTLYVRYEEINLYILIKTFLNTGFSKMKDNYKYFIANLLILKLYLVIFMMILLFRLKNNYSKAKYICIHEQNSILDFSEHAKIIIKKIKRS